MRDPRFKVMHKGEAFARNPFQRRTDAFLANVASKMNGKWLKAAAS